MKLQFRTFNCGAGDCLFMMLKKETGSFHIMVDCGKLKDDIQEYVENELGKRIDLLVVTHIDNDHIAGLTTLLEKVPDLQIEKILFNCYHRPKIKDPLELLDEKQAAVLQELKCRLPLSQVTADGKTSANEAISLSEKILKNEKWAKAWSRAPVIAGMPIDMDGGYGKITILSPLPEDLNALEDQFKKEFWAKFFDKYSNQYENEEAIYEVLLRLWESTLVEKRTAKVSYTKPTKELFIKAAETKVMPVSLTNKCSIAFIYEYEDCRLLLLGDSDPGIVVNSINTYLEVSKPLVVNLIKVSHHGSSHSTTNELVETVDSIHYYFAGGNKGKRPSLETLSRIITAPLSGLEKRVLHFNRHNKVLKDLCSTLDFSEFSCEIDLKNATYEIEL